MLTLLMEKRGIQMLTLADKGGWGGPEVEKVVDSVSLTHRKYFQKLGLTENIWENIMG